MSISTVHGRVMDRPVQDHGPDLLGTVVVATATEVTLSFVQSKPLTPYSLIHVQFYDIEKIDVANANLRFYISNAGTTIDTSNDYNVAYQAWSATSALTTTGATGNAAFNVVPAASPFSLATASGTKPNGVVNIWITNPAATGYVAVSWDSGFLNSASGMVSSYGHGGYATGPCAGVSLQTSAAGADFSAKGIAWGYRSVPR